MALTTKNLNYNLITAELDGERGIAKFKYGDLDYVPKILVYGGMKLVTQSGFEGIYGSRTLCIDIKDDETERLIFVNLVETFLRVGGGCINEKPWKIESPLMGCGGSYTISCMVASSKLSSLDFDEYRRGWCELRVFAACTVYVLLNSIAENCFDIYHIIRCKYKFLPLRFSKFIVVLVL